MSCLNASCPGQAAEGRGGSFTPSLPRQIPLPCWDGTEHRAGQRLTHGHSPFPRTELSTLSASNRHRDAIQTQQGAGSLAGVQGAEYGCAARKPHHFQKQNCVLDVVKLSSDAHLNAPI